MNSPTYCVDTSSWIHAWVRSYPPAIFPSFWSNMEAMIDRGEIVAPENVLWELEKVDDDLAAWAKERGEMFRPVVEIQGTAKSLIQKYDRLIRNGKGISDADAWVIALAKDLGITVVSQEKRIGKREKARMPDVCGYEGITHVSILQMLTAMGWTF